MKTRNRLVVLCLTLILILSTAAPVYAVTPAQLKARYRVTSNFIYNTCQNGYMSYKDKKSAINAYNKIDPYIREEYFVYDSYANKVIYPDLSTLAKRRKKAVNWVIAIARDNRHGYSLVGESQQKNTDLWKTNKFMMERWGVYGCYSCSTLVEMAYELFGYESLRLLSKKYPKGMSDHGNMIGYNSTTTINALEHSRWFVKVTNWNNMKPGTILITPNQLHVGMYIGNNQIVEACSVSIGIRFNRFNRGSWGFAYSPRW